MSHADAVRFVRDSGSDLALTLDGHEADVLRQVGAWGELLMLVVPIGHAFGERDRVSLAEIAAERIALPRPDACPGYLAQIEGMFSQQQLTIADRVTVKHWNTAVSFAATGRAIALCPASIVAGATGAAVVPIEDEVELITWMLYREGEPSDAARDQAGVGDLLCPAHDFKRWPASFGIAAIRQALSTCLKMTANGAVRRSIHAQVAAASRHCSMAPPRKLFRVLRETRWRSTLKVLWTAAWADRKRCADPGDLNRCILRSRRRVG